MSIYEGVTRKRKNRNNPLLEMNNDKLSEAERKQRSRRNIKVYDEAYFDIVALSQFKQMTQNDLLEWLVENVVKELDEKEKLIFEHLRDKAKESSLQKKKK